MLDIDELMSDLSLRRPIFHSEADFQHALAWRIHETRPDCDVRLEFNPSPDADSRMAVDIWVRLPEGTVAIELKYCTRELQQEWRNERFVLRQHGGQPPRRYDFVKDVQRLEWTLQIPSPADYGFAVLLANESMYWTPPTRTNITDIAFRIHDGHRIGSGELRWGISTGAKTKQNREEPIYLNGTYALYWRDYSTFGNNPGEQFRYVAVAVPPAKERTP
ncbi:MAG: hypothetical protein J4G13_09110 [Dehalococcoidia bacterium]|nr:hypothetical protein [Dehalococcoidia bacterium]